MNGYRLFIRLWLLMVAVLTLSVNSWGQQYKTARTDSRVFYEGGGEMHTVQVVAQQGLGSNDTAFTFYTVVDTGTGLPATCDLIPNAIGWLGERMVVQDSLRNLFFNAQGDTITFRPGAALGNVYRIYTFPNGDYMEATNIGLQFAVFIDSFSRFKTIQLQVRNSQGQPIAHPMNGKTMEFSERFGMKKGFNLYHFPNDTTTYRLIGHESAGLGQRSLNVFHVFDIRPGYEFHFVERQNGLVTALEKQFVQQAFDIGLGDTFLLTYERWRKEYLYDALGEAIDSSFINDTITERIVYADYSFLNGSHRQVFEYRPDTFGYAIHRLVDSLGPRFRKDMQWPYTLSSGAVCLEPQPDSVLTEHYGDGLGLTLLRIARSNGDMWERQMVYYQRGIEQWGNFIDFYPLGLPDTKEHTLTLAPNPSKDILRIEGLTSPLHVAVFHISGAKVWEDRIYPDEVLSISDWPAGVYFLIGSRDDQVYRGKLIKL